MCILPLVIIRPPIITLTNQFCVSLVCAFLQITKMQVDAPFQDSVKKDLVTACADYNRVIVLNDIMWQLKDGLNRLGGLTEGIRSSQFIDIIQNHVDSNYKILYDAFTSDEVKDIMNVSMKTHKRQMKIDTKLKDDSNKIMLRNQFHAYKKELEILNRIKRFIEDDIRLKGVILSVVSNALDEDDEDDEDAKFINENKDKYYNDYYVLCDIAHLNGDDHTLVLLDNFITLEKVEARIKTCYESMGWISEEIFW